MRAASAALAAGLKGKFWEFHDLLFRNFDRLDDPTIRNIALGLGLDQREQERMMKDPMIQSKIIQDIREGNLAGVKGTPMAFINGNRLRELTLKGLQASIDKELYRLNKGM